MKELKPLEFSHQANDIEKELKALTIDLFNKHLANLAKDINCYGMPHLGSKSLLNQYLISQNIANFNTENLSDESLRYLTQAWKFKNLKRGTYFLQVFLTCVWGADFEVSQLWQKKTDDYPTVLKTLEEIEESGESRNDYFLTGRLKITLFGSKSYFASSVAKALNDVLPARLMIQDVDKVVSSEFNFIFSDDSKVHTTYIADGYDFIEVFEHNDMHVGGSHMDIYSINYGSGAER